MLNCHNVNYFHAWLSCIMFRDTLLRFFIANRTRQILSPLLHLELFLRNTSVSFEFNEIFQLRLWTWRQCSNNWKLCSIGKFKVVGRHATNKLSPREFWWKEVFSFDSLFVPKSSPFPATRRAHLVLTWPTVALVPTLSAAPSLVNAKHPIGGGS